ncbi:MAG: methyltransferase domain-containing protein [Anaerolineae bacterium]|jgi:SAM-dependent methyltransferase
MDPKGDLDPTADMYATPEPLQVRIRTHEWYTRPQVDFVDWVVTRIRWQGAEQVLDVGCGSGAYVERICRRLGRGGRFLAVDISWGMLQGLLANSLPAGACLFMADAMHLPLPDKSCDVVLANHMLYDVPVIEWAVAEGHRVLRPGGRMVTATNAQDSMAVFITEMEVACRALGSPKTFPEIPSRVRFTLENGASFLKSLFPRVRREVLTSALVFEEAAPAVAYVDSLRFVYAPQLPGGLAWEAVLAQVRRQVEAQIATQGVYRVPKTAGVFIAVR